MQPAQRPTIAQDGNLFNEQSSATNTHRVNRVTRRWLASLNPFTHAAQQIGLSMAVRQEVPRGLMG